MADREKEGTGPAYAASLECNPLKSQVDANKCSRDVVKNTSERSLSDEDGRSDLPQITQQEEKAERSAVSKKERLLAFADLYGRKHPTDLEKDQNLDAFDREVSRLPIEQKSALHRGYTVQQALLFLDIEGNDARCAAKRMAKFWDERFKQFGEDAFAEEHMQLRTDEDFRRVYEMALKAPMDPEVDGETKRWAKKFTSEWNRGHILDLEQELAQMSDHEKASLVEAQKLMPEIAASDKHKLIFLRCEDFDARRAARRLVKYWDFKFDLFGREGAFGSFTVNDLMRDHPLEVSLGFSQNIRGTDAFGRALMYVVPSKAFASLMHHEGCTEKGLLKVLWYTFHTVLEEERSCDKNGVVLLVDDRHSTISLLKPSAALKMKRLVFDSLPVKIKAVHLLAPPIHSFFHQTMLPFIKWFLGKTMRMRLWVHSGTEEERLSELQECGISRDLIPTSLGGNMDFEPLGRVSLKEMKEAAL